jgi:hypothetical protein
VIGAVISRKSRERIPPFTELQADDEAARGAASAEAAGRGEAQGLPEHEDSFFLD